MCDISNDGRCRRVVHQEPLGRLVDGFVAGSRTNEEETMSRSVGMVVRVAILAAGATALILALGTMNATVQGSSPYTSALGDLNVANASAEPNTCSDLKCALTREGGYYCKSTAGWECVLDEPGASCMTTHC